MATVSRHCIIRSNPQATPLIDSVPGIVLDAGIEVNPVHGELRLDPVEVFPLPQLREINLVNVMEGGTFCLTQSSGVRDLLIKGHKFV